MLHRLFNFSTFPEGNMIEGVSSAFFVMLSLMIPQPCHLKPCPSCQIGAKSLKHITASEGERKNLKLKKII